MDVFEGRSVLKKELHAVARLPVQGEGANQPGTKRMSQGAKKPHTDMKLDATADIMWRIHKFLVGYGRIN